MEIKLRYLLLILLLSQCLYVLSINRFVKVVAGSLTGRDGRKNETFLISPTGVWGDTIGNLYFSDSELCVVRKLHVNSNIVRTVVGTGVCDQNRDGLTGTLTSIQQPWKMYGDTLGSLYFVEGNTVRRLSSSNIVTIVAGSRLTTSPINNVEATSSGLSTPSGVWVDSYGNIYIADLANCLVRRVKNSTMIISNFAGNGVCADYGDGSPSTSARLAYPNDVQGDTNGNIYIMNAAFLRKVSPSGIITNYLTFSTSPMGFWLTTDGDLYVTSYGDNSVLKYSSTGGPPTYYAGSGIGGQWVAGPIAATLGLLDSPSDVFMDTMGVLYITERGNRVVRSVSVGNMMTLAVGGARIAGDGDAATNAIIGNPVGIWGSTDSSLYFIDDQNGVVSKVSPSGVFSPIYGRGILIIPTAIVGDTNGALFIADVGRSSIVRFTSTTVNTFAGSDFTPGCDGDNNGPTVARIFWPTGLWMNSLGSLYIADALCHTVRFVLAGKIRNFAGQPSQAGNSGNGGQATDALLDTPSTVTGDSLGNIFIADATQAIRQVEPTGIIRQLTIFSTSGSGVPFPVALGGDGQGSLYLVLTYDYTIVRYTDYLSTSFSSDEVGAINPVSYGTVSSGPANIVPFGQSRGIWIDTIGNMFLPIQLPERFA